MKRKTGFFIRQGFTLIELLVVIAIIAILASLLLPVLSKAKKSAKDTGCISNMKEIGVAIALYNSDNREAYPNDMEGEYEMPFVGEWRLLSPSIATNQASFYLCPADNAKDAWNIQNATLRELINPRLLLWPSSYYPYLSFYNPDSCSTVSGGCNPGLLTPTLRHVTEVRSPSLKAMVTCYTGTDYCVSAPGDDKVGGTTGAHGNGQGLNWLMADCRAQYIPFLQMTHVCAEFDYRWFGGDHDWTMGGLMGTDTW
ncbi:MAG: type II secretion system protein [Limisphaerales bacterium]